jgi:DNA-directed RNA polymerase specialized sigma24 family protein
MCQIHLKAVSAPRAECATPQDFCSGLVRNVDSLYLLAFLLTANHQVAEQCFAATAEERFEHLTVFKEWVEPWLKRSLVKNAIRRILPEADHGADHWEPWAAGESRCATIDGITRLPVLERSVFVLSTLERYSTRKCAAILGCEMETVVQARSCALLLLPSLIAGCAMPDAGKVRSTPLYLRDAALHAANADRGIYPASRVYGS